MDIKLRLQRVLQILEEAEREGVLADIERDMVLGELREAYAELKFGKTENGELKTENEEQSEIAPIAPIAHIESEPESEPEPEPEEESEPEVEVELIFDEESVETENGERKTENEEQQEVENEEVQEQEENLSTINSQPSTLNPQLSTPKRSPLLSLYEDAPTPVIGEQFHEKPSVADTIACPKGVAESAPVTSLRKAIGVADRFMLISELFGGDAEAYEATIDALENQPSFDDCIIFIAEHYAWSPNAQATKLVMDLLQRKYK